ncbi:CPXCG motif-containing cysteine-rich protein [Candidatus Ruthturnera calyptogenae]
MIVLSLIKDYIEDCSVYCYPINIIIDIDFNQQVRFTSDV